MKPIQFALALLFLLYIEGGSAQESANQNQSDTLINKEIYLPLQTEKNHTFCPFYVPKNTSQWQYMSELVYRAFTGQYRPLADASVYQAQGILNASAYYRDPIGNVNKVNLLTRFDGSLRSSNRCGQAQAIKFVNGNGTYWRNDKLRIDGTPAIKPVLNHLTAYLGYILGCSEARFPRYSGRSSQFEAHQFMNLAQVEMHYFIHNIYDSALTSGISQPDGIIIGTALDNLFNKRCAPPRRIVDEQPAGLQNMCLHEDCAMWRLGNSTCAAYAVPGAGEQPAAAMPDHARTDFHSRCTPKAGQSQSPCGSKFRGHARALLFSKPV